MAEPGQDESASQSSPPVQNDEELSTISPTRTRGSSSASSRMRSASNRFLESSPPSGMWHATGQVVAKAPTPAEIRKGAFSHDGWDEEMQRKHSIVNEENVRKLTRNPSYSQSTTLSPGPMTQLHAHAEEDDESDPFEKFIGRGRIESQSFTRTPKAKSSESADSTSDVKGLEVETARESVDSDDSLASLEGRPVRRHGSSIPKAFSYLSG